MWNYYCSECNRKFDEDEMELREDQYEGDYNEFHILCNSKVLVLLKP